MRHDNRPAQELVVALVADRAAQTRVDEDERYLAVSAEHPGTL